MKRLLALTCLLCATAAAAGDNFGIDPAWGEFGGRIQTLSMWRDYEKGAPNSEYSHTLGVQADWRSPEFGGLRAGVSYSGVGVLGASNEAHPAGEAMVLNGRVNTFNEAYLAYSFGAGTRLTVGRRAVKNEIFRYTEARQKKRAIEGAMIESAGIPGLKVAAGHTVRLSNIYGFERVPGYSWCYEGYGEVFRTGVDTDGLTWAEAVWTGAEGLELALYDAHAWDVAALTGARLRWDLGGGAALAGLYRNESGLGLGEAHDAQAYGVALHRDVGGVALEGGWFGVRGDKLHFEENTTGINHALGYSLLLDTDHFRGGSNTFYVKAVAKPGRTVLYALVNVTTHDELPWNGREIDVVVKRPLSDRLTAALKGGLGIRELDDGEEQVQSDLRLFITHAF